MTVREGVPADGPAYLELLLQLDRETEMMLYEPGERATTPEEAASYIQGLRRDGSALLLAEEGGALLGFLTAERGTAARIRHSAYVVAGVRSTARGRGVGSALFAALDGWTAANGIRRLELTVRTDNAPAIALYKKSGFTVEEERRGSLLVHGNPVDEYAMSKLL